MIRSKVLGTGIQMLIQLLSTFTHMYKCGLGFETSNHVGNICWILEATYNINICWKVKPHFWTPLVACARRRCRRGPSRTLSPLGQAGSQSLLRRLLMLPLRRPSRLRAPTEGPAAATEERQDCPAAGY